MAKSLLFLPDISGFTNYVKNTKIEDSREVIRQLLEGLVEANILNMELVEIEGDALFFYSQNIPSKEELFRQVNEMYGVFYGLLQSIKQPSLSLQLKIVAHSANIEFIEIGGSRKPFGLEVIEIHQLLKNSIESNSYILITDSLAKEMGLSDSFHNESFQFQSAKENYGEHNIDFLFSHVHVMSL